MNGALVNVPSLHHLTPGWAAVAVAVGIISTARTARLLVFDDFPPVFWLRSRVLAAVPVGSKWAKLVECPFCLAPYLIAGNMAWAWFSDLHWTWWLANAWWAASYVAAIVVAYDEGVT